MDVFFHELHADNLVRLGTGGAVKQGIVFLVNWSVLGGGLVLLRVISREHVKVHSQGQRVTILLVRSTITVHPHHVISNFPILFHIH